jgi:CRP-like cAMP-binding protein
VPAATNGILRTFAPKDLAAISERMKRVTLAHGELLGESGAPIEQVVFPLSGMVSVVAELATGERIEVALIGRSGVLGASAIFGARAHISTSFVQAAGSALAVRAAELVDFARQRDQVRNALFRHEQYIMAQSQQSVACNARHDIPQRLATWLMRARDSLEQNELALTQEFLAQMLGVQRASVSLVASKLQDEGLIRYRRGRIEIIDETKLGERACECCGTVRIAYRQLLGDGAGRA